MKSIAELTTRLEELRQLIQDARNEIASAETALADSPDEAGRVRAHKRFDIATGELNRYARELPAAEKALVAARQAEADSVEDAKWNELEKRGRVWLGEMETLLTLLDEVAKQHVRVFDAGVAVRAAYPSRRDGAEESSFMWGSERLTRETVVQLAMLSEGRFNAPGIGKTELWNLAQGPNIVAKVRENLARLNGRRPRRSRAA